MTRLSAVCSLIEPAPIIADVGCDHGKVAGYCADSVPCDTVIASDISESCLNKARTALSGKNKVVFVCCDGIGYRCDEAVIAGMGGFTAAGILEKAESLPETVVVCPHRDAPEVRKTLCRLGYGIDADIMCKERGKLYPVIRGKKSVPVKELDALQILFGVFSDRYDDLLVEYLLGQYDICMLSPDNNKQKTEYVLAALSRLGVAPERRQGV